MTLKLLENELNEVQKRYLSILKSLIDSNLDPSNETLDVIEVFWRINRRFVIFTLAKYFEPHNTAFIKTSNLDAESFNHVSFFLLNRFHIKDDPILNYIEYMRVRGEREVSESVKNDIISTIKNNIDVIESNIHGLYVLPVSFLLDTEENCKEQVERIFLSFFKLKSKSMKSFFAENNTIDKIIENLADDLEGRILFSDDDDIEKNIFERFKEFKSKFELISGRSFSDIDAFKSCIISHIASAYKVLLLVIEYKLIPFVESNVLRHYLFLLFESLNDKLITDTSVTRNKILQYIAIERIIDKSKFERLALDDIRVKSQNTDFDQIYYKELLSQNSNFFSIDIQFLVEKTEKMLNDFIY